MEDAHLLAAVAERLVFRHGDKSLAAIAEHCQMASAIGDQLSLQTWQSIAVAVQQLRGSQLASATGGPVRHNDGADAPDGINTAEVEVS